MIPERAGYFLSRTVLPVGQVVRGGFLALTKTGSLSQSRRPTTRLTIEQATAGGRGGFMTVACWGGRSPLQQPGPLRGGTGAAARQASEHRHVNVTAWALPELIEATARR